MIIVNFDVIIGIPGGGDRLLIGGSSCSGDGGDGDRGELVTMLALGTMVFRVD